MRLLIRRFIWSVLILGSASGVFANLLENGSFEGFARGKFDGWHVPKTDAEGAFSHGVIRQDTTQAKEGGASLALQFNGGETEGDEELVFRVRPAKPVAVSPGKKHRITFQTKGEGGPFLIVLDPFTADAEKKKKEIKPVNLAVGPEWQMREAVVNVPENGLFLGFQIKIVKAKGVAGTVWLDDFAVEEMGES